MVSHHAVELARRVALWSTGGIVVTILLVSSTLGWQLIDVTVTEMSENPSTRYGLYWPDARAACRYVADHLQPGDGVTGTYNYSFFHFTGHWVDFTLNEDLADVSTFNPNRGAYGLYENNYIHVPALQTDRDFAKAFSRFKRLWYIGYISPSTDPDVIKKVDSYVIHRSRVVYSGFQVNVYLADGMAAKPGEQIPDLGLPPSPGLSSIDDETKP